MTVEDVINELQNTFSESDLCCHEQQPLSFEYRVRWAHWRLEQRAQAAQDAEQAEQLAKAVAESEQQETPQT